jgi:pimeloyl-ACP methyl ester carboxylesterase
VALWYERAGDGPPVVFIHPGIADSGVWDPQWSSFVGQFSLVRCDLPGFGRTPIEGPAVRLAAEVAALLDSLAIAHAALVGCSVGGRVALELAVARPELVSALVLVGAGLPGWAWSEEVEAYGAAEDEAVSRGDLDAATELNLRIWVDGPVRTPADVDPGVRAAVGAMERRALELQAPHWETVTEEPLVSDLADRLGQVRARTLVLVGEHDVSDVHRLADLLAGSIPDARSAPIPGAAHVPNLEQPEAFDALVLPFLGFEA